MKFSNSDRAELSLEHVVLLRSHLTRGQLNDQLILDAACMQLMSSIEQLTHVEDQLLVQAFGKNWPEIKATRNAIAHAYTFLEKQILADTIIGDLDEFERAVRSLIDQN